MKVRFQLLLFSLYGGHATLLQPNLRISFTANVFLCWYVHLVVQSNLDYPDLDYPDLRL